MEQRVRGLEMGLSIPVTSGAPVTQQRAVLGGQASVSIGPAQCPARSRDSGLVSLLCIRKGTNSSTY